MLIALVATLVICFLLNVPIGFALGMAALASLIASGTLPITMIPQRMVAGANSFPLLAIPYFMLAGSIMERGGVSRRIVNLASALVGHITGGLAAVSIGMYLFCCCFWFNGGDGSSGRRTDHPGNGQARLPKILCRGGRISGSLSWRDHTA